MGVPHVCGPNSLSMEERSILCSACWALSPMVWRASLWWVLNLPLLLLLFFLFVLHSPRAWVPLGPARTSRRRHPSFSCQTEDIWDCSPKVLCSPVPVVGWFRFWGCWRGRFGPLVMVQPVEFMGSCRNPKSQSQGLGGGGQGLLMCFTAVAPGESTNFVFSCRIQLLNGWTFINVLRPSQRRTKAWDGGQ